MRGPNTQALIPNNIEEYTALNVAYYLRVLLDEQIKTKQKMIVKQKLKYKQ